jgi:hypothetical protein
MTNPHTRYEIRVDRIPVVVLLALIILMVVSVCGSIYLASTTPGEIVPLPKVHLHVTKPDLSGTIQRKVNAHNPFLTEVR